MGNIGNKTFGSVSKGIEKNLSLDFENLMNLPCHVFWKNAQGVYENYNDYGAARLGFKNGAEIIRRTDEQVFPRDMGSLYRKDDIEVMNTKKEIFFPEPGVLKDNVPIVFLSYKIPVYDQGGRVIGVLGMSFTRSLSSLNELSDLNHSAVAEKLAKEYNYSPQEPNVVSLPDRENSCVYYLCLGLTNKEIARKLNISPRTVETYVERAKIRFCCHNKAELILRYLNTYK